MSEFQQNPYAAGVVQKENVHADVEAIRHQYLSHEASIKSIGILYILSGAFAVLAGFGYVIAAVNLFNTPTQAGQPPNDALAGFLLVAGPIVIMLGAGQIAVAIGLRKLAPWSKIPTAVLAGIGLLFFPVGTLINGYVLYLLLSEKGTMVFSPQYKEVIRQTPHIKYKTSIIVLVLLGILVLFILIAISALVFGA